MYRLPLPSPEAEGRPDFPVAAVQVGGKAELDAGARLRELSQFTGTISPQRTACELLR